MLSSTHNWVDSIKFIARPTIPDILPLFKTKLGDARNKVICWEFHFCNGKGQSRFSCSVGFLVAWDVYMTWDPTKDDRFPIVGEMCIVFDYFLYAVQLEFNPIQGFKAGHRVRKYDKVGVPATTNEIHGKGNYVKFSSEDARIVW